MVLLRPIAGPRRHSATSPSSVSCSPSPPVGMASANLVAPSTPLPHLLHSLFAPAPPLCALPSPASHLLSLCSPPDLVSKPGRLLVARNPNLPSSPGTSGLPPSLLLLCLPLHYAGSDPPSRPGLLAVCSSILRLSHGPPSSTIGLSSRDHLPCFHTVLLHHPSTHLCLRASPARSSSFSSSVLPTGGTVPLLLPGHATSPSLFFSLRLVSAASPSDQTLPSFHSVGRTPVCTPGTPLFCSPPHPLLSSCARTSPPSPC